MSDKDESKEIIAWTVAIVVLFIAFYGDPDVVDAIRVIFLDWANLGE